MSTLPLFVLHWGEVNVVKNINIQEVPPRGRFVAPITGGAVSKVVTGQGRIKTVKAMGKVRAVKGRAKTKTLKGRGRLC